MEASKEELGIDALVIRFWEELLAEHLGQARQDLGTEVAAVAWAEGRDGGT